jgi:hypothetical protein
MPTPKPLPVPGMQSANTIARTVAGLAGAGSKNVAPIHKPSTPAAHTVSPLPGKEPKSSNTASAIARAETLFKKDLSSKKPMTIDQARKDVLKKTGQWPNGATN